VIDLERHRLATPDRPCATAGAPFWNSDVQECTPQNDRSGPAVLFALDQDLVGMEAGGRAGLPSLMSLSKEMISGDALLCDPTAQQGTLATVVPSAQKT
jgi:hypothetical protein